MTCFSFGGLQLVLVAFLTALLIALRVDLVDMVYINALITRQLPSMCDLKCKNRFTQRNFLFHKVGKIFLSDRLVFFPTVIQQNTKDEPKN